MGLHLQREPWIVVPQVLGQLLDVHPIRQSDTGKVVAQRVYAGRPIGLGPPATTGVLVRRWDHAGRGERGLPHEFVIQTRSEVSAAWPAEDQVMVLDFSDEALPR